MRKLRWLSCLFALILCMTTLAVPAYAYADDPDDDDTFTIHTGTEAPPETCPPATQPPATTPPATQPPETTPPTTIAPQPNGEGFTPDGIAYTRDLQYDAATNKQYITIETRNGIIFYIVIDYDKPVDEKEDQFQTYFLNQVDEADLLALLDEEEEEPLVCICTEKCVVGSINTRCEICAFNRAECVGEEVTEPTAPAEPEEPEKTGSPLPALILLLAGGGGAAYYFLKVKKNGQLQTKGNSELDDYDFGDDEDEEYMEFPHADPDKEADR